MSLADAHGEAHEGLPFPDFLDQWDAEISEWQATSGAAVNENARYNDALQAGDTAADLGISDISDLVWGRYEASARDWEGKPALEKYRKALAAADGGAASAGSSACGEASGPDAGPGRGTVDRHYPYFDDEGELRISAFRPGLSDQAPPLVKSDIAGDARCSFVVKKLRGRAGGGTAEGVPEEDAFLALNEGNLLTYPDPALQHYCFFPPHAMNVSYDPNLCSTENEMLYDPAFADVLDVDGDHAAEEDDGGALSMVIDDATSQPMCRVRFKIDADPEKVAEYLKFLAGANPKRRWWNDVLGNIEQGKACLDERNQQAGEWLGRLQDATAATDTATRNMQLAETEIDNSVASWSDTSQGSCPDPDEPICGLLRDPNGTFVRGPANYYRDWSAAASSTMSTSRVKDAWMEAGPLSSDQKDLYFADAAYFHGMGTEGEHMHQHLNHFGNEKLASDGLGAEADPESVPGPPMNSSDPFLDRWVGFGGYTAGAVSAKAHTRAEILNTELLIRSSLRASWDSSLAGQRREVCEGVLPAGFTHVKNQSVYVRDPEKPDDIPEDIQHSCMYKDLQPGGCENHFRNYCTLEDYEATAYALEDDGIVNEVKRAEIFETLKEWATSRADTTVADGQGAVSTVEGGGAWHCAEYGYLFHRPGVAGIRTYYSLLDQREERSMKAAGMPAKDYFFEYISGARAGSSVEEKPYRKSSNGQCVLRDPADPAGLGACVDAFRDTCTDLKEIQGVELTEENTTFTGSNYFVVTAGGGHVTCEAQLEPSDDEAPIGVALSKSDTNVITAAPQAGYVTHKTCPIGYNLYSASADVRSNLNTLVDSGVAVSTTGSATEYTLDRYLIESAVQLTCGEGLKTEEGRCVPEHDCTDSALLDNTGCLNIDGNTMKVGFNDDCLSLSASDDAESYNLGVTSVTPRKFVADAPLTPGVYFVSITGGMTPLKVDSVYRYDPVNDTMEEKTPALNEILLVDGNGNDFKDLLSPDQHRIVEVSDESLSLEPPGGDTCFSVTKSGDTEVFKKEDCKDIGFEIDDRFLLTNTKTAGIGDITLKDGLIFLNETTNYPPVGRSTIYAQDKPVNDRYYTLVSDLAYGDHTGPINEVGSTCAIKPGGAYEDQNNGTEYVTLNDGMYLADPAQAPKCTGTTKLTVVGTGTSQTREILRINGTALAEINKDDPPSLSPIQTSTQCWVPELESDYMVDCDDNGSEQLINSEISSDIGDLRYLSVEIDGDKQYVNAKLDINNYRVSGSFDKCQTSPTAPTGENDSDEESKLKCQEIKFLYPDLRKDYIIAGGWLVLFNFVYLGDARFQIRYANQPDTLFATVNTNISHLNTIFCFIKDPWEEQNKYLILGYGQSNYMLYTTDYEWFDTGIDFPTNTIQHIDMSKFQPDREKFLVTILPSKTGAPQTEDENFIPTTSTYPPMKEGDDFECFVPDTSIEYYIKTINTPQEDATYLSPVQFLSENTQLTMSKYHYNTEVIFSRVSPYNELYYNVNFSRNEQYIGVSSGETCEDLLKSDDKEQHSARLRFVKNNNNSNNNNEVFIVGQESENGTFRFLARKSGESGESGGCNGLVWVDSGKCEWALLEYPNNTNHPETDFVWVIDEKWYVLKHNETPLELVAAVSPVLYSSALTFRYYLLMEAKDPNSPRTRFRIENNAFKARGVVSYHYLFPEYTDDDLELFLTREPNDNRVKGEKTSNFLVRPPDKFKPATSLSGFIADGSEGSLTFKLDSDPQFRTPQRVNSPALRFNCRNLVLKSRTFPKGYYTIQSLKNLKFLTLDYNGLHMGNSHVFSICRQDYLSSGDIHNVQTYSLPSGTYDYYKHLGYLTVKSGSSTVKGIYFGVRDIDSDLYFLEHSDPDDDSVVIAGVSGEGKVYVLEMQSSDDVKFQHMENITSISQLTMTMLSEPRYWWEIIENRNKAIHLLWDVKEYKFRLKHMKSGNYLALDEYPQGNNTVKLKQDADEESIITATHALNENSFQLRFKSVYQEKYLRCDDKIIGWPTSDGTADAIPEDCVMLYVMSLGDDGTVIVTGKHEGKIRILGIDHESRLHPPAFEDMYNDCAELVADIHADFVRDWCKWRIEQV
jgi:hypothetical protein